MRKKINIPSKIIRVARRTKRRIAVKQNLPAHKLAIMDAWQRAIDLERELQRFLSKRQISWRDYFGGDSLKNIDIQTAINRRQLREGGIKKLIILLGDLKRTYTFLARKMRQHKKYKLKIPIPIGFSKGGNLTIPLNENYPPLKFDFVIQPEDIHSSRISQRALSNWISVPRVERNLRVLNEKIAILHGHQQK